MATEIMHEFTCLELGKCEKLAVSGPRGSLQSESLAGDSGGQDRDRALLVLLGNAETTVIVPQQIQSSGILKFRDDANKAVLDAEVSLLGAVNAVAILDILVDAVGWEFGVALVVTGDNAELELLQVLVEGVSSHDHIVARQIGHEAIEIVAVKLECLVLLDGDMGDALVGFGCDLKG